jgi:hypothetical protein
MPEENYINANPNPEFLVKSIAEQGYSLETALADLVDNSISAQASRVEIISFDKGELKSLLIADNGNGMTFDKLKESMMFPSSDMDATRSKNDLGRFGLGLKTASFSQTRKFSVLTKPKKEPLSEFNCLTWDVDKLSASSGWRIFNENEITRRNLIKEFEEQSAIRLEHSDDFVKGLSTLIHWANMRKFSRENSYLSQLENVKEYLGIVFHKFIESGNLTIRFNGELITPFNPFPSEGIFMEESQSLHGFKMTGFVVSPEYKKNERLWETRSKSLYDLEGVYIYRNNRLIYFGGWNGLRSRTSKLKLARLKIDFENPNDILFLLNVDKSRVTIPIAAKDSVISYIEELEILATRQLYNRPIEGSTRPKEKKVGLIVGKYNSKGRFFEFNTDFPLLKDLKDDLNDKQSSKLAALLRIVQVAVNRLIETHEDIEILDAEGSYFSSDDLIRTVESLKGMGMDVAEIEKFIFHNLGITNTTMTKQVIRDNF